MDGTQPVVFNSTPPAFAFNTNGRFVVPPAKAPSLAGPSTISVWMKAATTQESALVSHGYYAGAGGYMLWFANGEVRLYVQKSARATVAVGAGSWSHIVATLDGTSAVIAKNGVVAQTLPYSGYPADVSMDLEIGTYGGSHWYQGLMNDVRLYSGAFSASEITALYNDTKAIYGL